MNQENSDMNSMLLFQICRQINMIVNPLTKPGFTNEEVVRAVIQLQGLAGSLCLSGNIPESPWAGILGD